MNQPITQVPTLSTPSFTLRSLRYSDAEALFPTFSNPAHCQYLTRPAFTSEEELWGWLAEPGWKGRTWIAEDSSGHVAGRFVAIPAHEAGVEEIGYVTCANRQRQGVARECMSALITYLFETPIEDRGARKITAEVDTRNAASIRLIERLGFTREAHLREHEATHIGMCDIYLYGRLKTD